MCRCAGQEPNLGEEGRKVLGSRREGTGQVPTTRLKAGQPYCLSGATSGNGDGLDLDLHLDHRLQPRERHHLHRDAAKDIHRSST